MELKENGESIRQDGLELINVSEDEYNESKKFIESHDAIMDDSVFYHIKKVISYLYCNEELCYNDKNERKSKSKDDYKKELNRNVLNTLVDGYVGYAWLCEVCARWIDEFNATLRDYNSDSKDKNPNITGTMNVNIIQIYDSLMTYLMSKYDTDKMRDYMEDKGDHGRWNPPELYWNLMKSPLVVSYMLKIYRDKPKDEFLSAWYQDYMNNFSSYMKMEQNEVNKESLSRITSNFSIFTLRMSEEIRRFLLKDDVLDCADVDMLGSVSPLFWHAENAYIYSQALLHFIYQWRIDLRGCRRLSQLIAKATIYPQSDMFKGSTNSDYALMEWSTSQIHLLMTNFSRFPTLYSSFKRLVSSQNTAESLKLNHSDVSDFYEELNKTLSAFDSCGFLLFDRRESKRERYEMENTPDVPSDEFFDQSVSQYGDTTSNNEYMRMRNGPEMPPLEAIRESNLLNALIEDFSNPDVMLPDPNVWIRYANLIVLLSAISPYEMLYFYYDEKVCNYIKKMPQREVWQQFYLPPSDYDDDDEEDSIEEIENIRDYGIGENQNQFDLQQLGESDYVSETSSFVEYDNVKVVGDIDKAWNINSQASSSILSSNAFSSEVYRDKEMKREVVYEQDNDEYMEIKSTLASAIYKNVHDETKLGVSRNISPERILEMKELYSDFKVKCDRLKNIARKELYQLFKLIHSQSNSTMDSEYEMLTLISTNIAASIVISYITQVIQKRGNINALCNIKLLLLKSIADKHPVKRTSIIVFLRNVCKSYVSGHVDDDTTNSKLERLEAIVDLLVYITRFEKQAIPVIVTFDSIMNLLDRSISRLFIIKILKFCGPPYSFEFSLTFIKLIENFFNLGNVDISSEKERSFILRYVKPFITECLENNHESSELVQIAKRYDIN